MSIGGKLRKPLFGAGLVVLLIGVAHVWVISGGKWRAWSAHTTFYSHLADGFMHGQLSLPDVPPPELLALPDPYDPRVNWALRLHDAVLFNGRYYMYWGPVPSLLAIPFCLAVGKTHPTFGDQYLVFIFALGLMIVTSVFMIHIQRRLFASQRLPAVLIAVLSLGMGAPLLFLLLRPAVYEAAILAAQFFLLAGLLSIWIAFNRDERRAVPLALAGIFFTLSVGSRVSLAPAIGVVVLLALWRWPRPACFAGLILPLAIGGVLYGWYNFARFHSVMDFGLRYQLAGANQHTMAASQYSSPRFILPNILLYTFSQPDYLKKFPYVRASTPRWTSAMFRLGPTYRIEKLVGLIETQAFLLFALVAIGWRSRDKTSDWLRRSLWAAAILGFIPALMIDGGTERYLTDTVPCCTILAAMGFWKLLAISKRHSRARLLIESLAGALVILQCVTGLLLMIGE
jgi:hypothetical protein